MSVTVFMRAKRARRILSMYFTADFLLLFDVKKLPQTFISTFYIINKVRIKRFKRSAGTSKRRQRSAQFCNFGHVFLQLIFNFFEM